MIDGYDEAASCSCFASGLFDIDVIFHVHCTKPVWCVTPGSQSSLNPSHISDVTQVGVATEFPLDPAQIIYPPLVTTGTEPYSGDTHSTVPTLPCQSQSGFEELLYVGPSGFIAVETQASSEPYSPPGPSGFFQWGYVTNLTIATPTSNPSILTPSTQVLLTLQALSCLQPYPLS